MWKWRTFSEIQSVVGSNRSPKGPSFPQIEKESNRFVVVNATFFCWRFSERSPTKRFIYKSASRSTIFLISATQKFGDRHLLCSKRVVFGTQLNNFGELIGLIHIYGMFPLNVEEVLKEVVSLSWLLNYTGRPKRVRRIL